jgi:NADPH2:quinone reductase
VYGIRVSQFGSEDVLEYVSMRAPEPGAGQVRVRVRAAGVNPADTYVRTGTYVFYKPALPYTPGFDGAGDVDAVGPGVTGLAPGDRVLLSALGGGSTGTYAELVVADASAVHPLPASVSYGQGAAVGVPCVTAWRALFQKADLRPGETVLVHGASGGVGIPAIQLAHDAGAVVIGTAGSPAGAELVRSAGADHVLDHTAAGYLDEIPHITHGHGVSVILEMLANVNLERDLGVLATRGRIVIIGSRGELPFTPRLTMLKEATILGTALWNATPDETTAALAGVGEKLAGGVIVPVVGTELPLPNAAEAHQQILANPAHGKMVLIPEPARS